LTDYSSRTKRERSTELGTHGERIHRVMPTSCIACLLHLRRRLFMVVNHWMLFLFLRYCPTGISVVRYVHHNSC